MMASCPDEILRLDNSKEIDQNLLNSTKKYSGIKISNEKNHISRFTWDMVRKHKGHVRYIEFQNCQLFESEYNLILDAIASTVEAVKFVKSEIKKTNAGKKEGGPAAKRMKTGETSPKFPKLKTLCLCRADLDIGDLCAQDSLTDLEILIDERQSFEENYYDRNRGKVDYYEQRYRFNNSSYLPDLMKKMPHLTTLRFGWSKNHKIQALPDEVEEYQEELMNVIYRGPFHDCEENMPGIPKIKNLEIYNLNFFDDGAEFLEFLPHLSSSLTTLKFTHGKYYMPIAVFMQVLENLEILTSLSVHIRASVKAEGSKTIYRGKGKKYNTASFANTSSVNTNQITAKDVFVHENLEELDVFFEDLEVNSLNVTYVFAAVRNIKTLKSNVPEETVKKFVAAGKFPLLETIGKTKHEKQASFSNLKECKECENLNDQYSEYDDFKVETIDGF